MPYDRKTPKRAPRPDEIDLLISLLDKPRVVDSGPLGRCLKRGWCVWLKPEISPTDRRWGPVPVSITLSGMAAVGVERDSTNP